MKHRPPRRNRKARPRRVMRIAHPCPCATRSLPHRRIPRPPHSPSAGARSGCYIKRAKLRGIMRQAKAKSQKRKKAPGAARRRGALQQQRFYVALASARRRGVGRCAKCKRPGASHCAAAAPRAGPKPR